MLLTTSPIKTTFSPLIKKRPRGISAYSLSTCIRSTESFKTKLAAYIINKYDKTKN